MLERIESLKNIWQALQMRKWKRLAAMAAAAAAVVVAATACGTVFELKSKPEETAFKSAPAGVDLDLPVNEEEALLLGTLYHALSGSDFDEAAWILNENEKAFDTLVNDVLAGERYYYREEMLEDGTAVSKMDLVSSEDTFTGMVLTRYNTVFYGGFSDGKPNGKGYAIQAMVLDHPRYSYAEGIWEDGKLNGEGRAGYYYYLDAPESGFVRTEKRGKFIANLLDGEFVYETEGGSGETLSWKIKAINGVTVITPDWEYYPYRKEYMLGSVEDSGRAYVLAKDKVATVLWNNLIVWPE